MTRRSRAPQADRWPLAKVFKARPSAVAVWQAMCDLADERRSPVVTPTRARIAAMTGINEQTVSDALTTLDEAGWIGRVHVPRLDGGKRVTLLRIVLHRTCRSQTPTKRSAQDRRRGSSTTSTVTASTPSKQAQLRKGSSPTHTVSDAVDVAERHKGRCSSTTADFPSERGGAPPAPPPSFHSGGSAGTPQESQGSAGGDDDATRPDAGHSSWPPIEGTSPATPALRRNVPSFRPQIENLLATFGLTGSAAREDTAAGPRHSEPATQSPQDCESADAIRP